MSFYENLHSSSQTQDKMKSTLLLDVVIRECTSILQLLTSKDQSLLIWRNSFLVLNLSFDVFNRVGWFNLKSDRLASQRFHEDLHTSSETKDKMKCTFLLDVVVRECATIFQLFASKDQPLLIWRNSFLVLNFCFYILNRVRWFHLQRNSLACESLDKDLHTASKTKNKMKGALLLDIVIRQGATVF